MTLKSAIQAAAAAIWIAACSAPLAINSPAFEKRAPLPGQMGYLETIKYKRASGRGAALIARRGDAMERRPQLPEEQRA
jgi:hypothetical protein